MRPISGTSTSARWPRASTCSTTCRYTSVLPLPVMPWSTKAPKRAERRAKCVRRLRAALVRGRRRRAVAGVAIGSYIARRARAGLDGAFGGVQSIRASPARVRRLANLRAAEPSAVAESSCRAAEQLEQLLSAWARGAALLQRRPSSPAGGWLPRSVPRPRWLRLRAAPLAWPPR